MGINGSALATLLSYVILGVVMATSSHYLARVQMADWCIWGKVAVAMAISFLTWFMPLSGPWLTTRVVLSVACAIWFAWIVRKLVSNVTRPEAWSI